VSIVQKLVLGTISALFFLAMLGSLEVRADERLDFNIDEGELGNALQSYSVQSGIQHLYTEPQLAQRPAVPVDGVYSAREALDLLLDDTGVSYRFTDSRTVRLFLSDDTEPAAPAAPPPEEEAPAAEPADSGAPVEDDAAGAAAVPAMEEIVVTARKREENLQDVPIAVTALSSEFINEAGLTSVFDVADYTPNLSFRESFGRTFDRPVIRGMSNIIGGANAGVFINGIFVPGSISTAELTNVERVEVIKGPQAALFGRATFAGAINYVIREPGDTLRGRVDLVYPELAPKTRTARARIVLDNPEGELKIGDWASLFILAGPKNDIVYVPTEAIIRTGQEERVIVQDDSETFSVRVIHSGLESGEFTEIIHGLDEGDRVVVSGQFLIDSEASINAGHNRLTSHDHE